MASIRSLTLILPLLLAACSGTQTSVERNASRAVSAINRIHFDPNTRMLRADSINSLKPIMQELYDQGKKDRSDGLTPDQARQRVESFSHPEVLSGGQKSRFLSQEYDADNPEKQRQILLDAGISSYWDGYNGRP